MSKKEAVRYHVMDGIYFLDGLRQGSPAVLDRGEWIETPGLEELGECHAMVPIGANEIEKLLEDGKKLKGFLDEAGAGKPSIKIYLNSDLEKIMELLEAERKELPQRAAGENPPGEHVGGNGIHGPEMEGLEEGSVTLCHAEEEGLSIYVSASLSKGKLTFSGQDLGERVKAFHGKDEYEYAYYLNQSSTEKLHRALKADHPETDGLLRLVEKAFSGPEGWMDFKSYCEKKDIEKGYFSI